MPLANQWGIRVDYTELYTQTQVPCVIALGVGVVAASPASAGKDNPLSAFGLVTMASLLPISTVLCLSLFLYRWGPTSR